MRRGRQPEQLSTPELLDEGRRVVESLYQESFEAPAAQITDLQGLEGGLRGVERPIQMPGTILLSGNFLPADDSSNHPVMRATGKEMTISIPRSHDLSGEAASADQYALINLRAAPGRFYDEALRLVLEKARTPWEFAGSRRQLAMFRFDPNDGEYYLVAAISDNHPVNEVPFFVKSNGQRPGDFDFAYSIPRFPVLHDEEIYQKEGKIIKRGQDGKEIGVENYNEAKFGPFVPCDEDSVFRGIRVLELMREYGIPNDPTKTRGQKFKQLVEAMKTNLRKGDAIPSDGKDFAGYDRLPPDDFSSYPYRAASLYQALITQARGYGVRSGRLSKEDKLNLSPDKLDVIERRVYEAALAQHALARIKSRTVKGHGFWGSIGVLDVGDPSMWPITQMLANNSGIKLEDKDQRQLLDGVVFIQHNGALPGSLTHQQLGKGKAGVGPQSPVLLQDVANSRGGYTGFGRYAEAAEELLGNQIEGKPKVPGILSLLTTQSSGSEAGTNKTEALLVVDIAEFPGFGAEWFKHHAAANPLNYYYDPQVGQDDKVTLRKIVTGEYSRQQQGPARPLANLTHAFLSLTGEVKAPDGYNRGYEMVQLLGPGDSFDMRVPVLVQNPNAKKGAELVPATGTEPVELRRGGTVELSSKRRRNGRPATKRELAKAEKRGELVPLKTTLPDTLSVDGLARVAGGIIDYQGGIRVNANTNSPKKNDEDNGPAIDIPVPDIRVMSRG